MLQNHKKKRYVPVEISLPLICLGLNGWKKWRKEKPQVGSTMSNHPELILWCTA